MASVKELIKESNVGYEMGDRGVLNLQRTFHVTVDKDPVLSRGHLPELVMQRKDMLDGDSIPIVYGSDHPTQPGFLAMRYRRLKNINETNFKIRVDYKPYTAIATPIDSLSLWEVEIDYGMEMEEVFFDLDGKPYGVPFYTEVEESDLVGPEFTPYAAEIPPGKIRYFTRPAAFVSAWAQRRLGNNYRVSDAERKIPIKAEAFQRPKRVGTLRLMREFEVLDDNRRAQAFDYVTVLNAFVFAGALEGQLRFDGLTSRDPRVGIDPKSRTPFDITRARQMRERITLSFSWNAKGWESKPYVHAWPDGKGNRAPIFDINEDPEVRQETLYRDYDYGDFWALLQLFD